MRVIAPDQWPDASTELGSRCDRELERFQQFRFHDGGQLRRATAREQRGERDHGDRRNRRRRLANAGLRSQRQYDDDPAAVRSHCRLYGRLGRLESADGFEIRLELRDVVYVRRLESARAAQQLRRLRHAHRIAVFRLQRTVADFGRISEQRNHDPADSMDLGLRYIDDCVLRDRTTEAALAHRRLFALQDANWNVIALFDPTADDDAGAIVERYAYTPYGVVLFLTPTSPRSQTTSRPTPGKRSTAATATMPRSGFTWSAIAGCCRHWVAGFGRIQIGLTATRSATRPIIRNVWISKRPRG